MSSNSAVTDTLPSSILKLDPKGVNWAIFLTRFQIAVKAKGKWGHFDGSSSHPTFPTLPLSDTEQALLDQWDKDEAQAAYLLSQRIPDSTMVCIDKYGTVAHQWAAVQLEYTTKGAYAQTDMRRRFMESRCTAKANLRDFLDNLRTKREELATVGVDITEDDYRSTILASIPDHYANFASNQLSMARMINPSATVDPDYLIRSISEEYDRIQAKHSSRSGGASKSTQDPDGAEALSVTPKGRSSKNVTCWNCNKKGHVRRNCPEPQKDSGSKSGHLK